MGLGKTVMTIALILSNPGRGNSENKDAINGYDDIIANKRKNAYAMHKVEGGTLIVCPLALLGQWKASVLCIIPNREENICLFSS